MSCKGISRGVRISRSRFHSRQLPIIIITKSNQDSCLGSAFIILEFSLRVSSCLVRLVNLVNF
uniref:Uncharacterized protein n=1 Tax=Helianthus annuus TaxID=4232 RepID=A0A251UCG9_HELAN